MKIVEFHYRPSRPRKVKRKLAAAACWKSQRFFSVFFSTAMHSYIANCEEIYVHDAYRNDTHIKSSCRFCTLMSLGSSDSMEHACDLRLVQYLH